jgi:hypothetical protein
MCIQPTSMSKQQALRSISEKSTSRCNIPDIKSMQNRNKMLEMADEQQYNQNNTTIIPK